MAVYGISFRIAADATYSTRYQSVVDAIKSAAGRDWWADTTSFFVIQSSKSAAELARYIDVNSTISPSKDLLLAINLSMKEHSLIGSTKDADLERLLKLR